MYSEGTPEYVVDHGVYYQPPMNYGYYYPGEWDGQPQFLDGHEIQYMGGQMGSFPYQYYYTPGYEYTQPIHNTYDPYASNAVMGSSVPQVYATPHQYNDYFLPAPYYQSAVQPRSDVVMNHVPGNISLPVKLVSKQTLSSSSAPYTMASANPITKHTHGSSGKFKESGVAQLQMNVEIGSKGAMLVPNIVTNVATQGYDKQLKNTLPAGVVLPNYPPGAYQPVAAGKINPALYGGRLVTNTNIRSNISSAQPLVHQVKKLDHQLIVKPYTSKAGLVNAEGNIVIHPDSYNKADFPVEYARAKFFVIKSYSEEDVHKSVKYNVWSSTPNGNKKLDKAFEDAQRVAEKDHQGCPVFLFFSVNASGNFCGVAEMAGRVDFNKDMDFWQQDKWSGSFPVKWHIIKDVPNVKFRHITLENNENNPVTYSRDTQEVMHKPGLEVLNIFKTHAVRASLLDDFMFYELREKAMHEERAGQTSKRSAVPVFIPGLHQPRHQKLNYVVSVPVADGYKVNDKTDMKNLKQVHSPSATDQVPSTIEASLTNTTKPGKSKSYDDPADQLKFGLLTISSEIANPLPEPALTPVPPNNEMEATITVGTMPVKINGIKKGPTSRTSVAKPKNTGSRKAG